VDVAFHVDIIQGRKGYDSEIALNAIRREYVERARGLPLSVMFNTTVVDCNFEAVPQIAEFFVARGRVNKLSFVIHNFVDACRLERDRVNACAFMAMTQRGPISVCLHDAKRDAFILAPIRLSAPDGTRFLDPVSGALTEESSGIHRAPDPNLKITKGRRRRTVTATDLAVR
jgi:hypothetical protein